MSLDVIDLTKQLVRIPSVNPMGRAIPSEIVGEGRLTDLLERTFAELGVACQRYTVREDPGGLIRENILARFDGRPRVEDGGQLLLLEAHQDTVPVDGMTIDPFAADLRDGRLYGRGACDTKGGLACIVSAASQLQQLNVPRPTIVVACLINEEFGFCGAKHLAALIRHGGDQLITRVPDGIVVIEPTELNVVSCHKGMVRWACETLGQAAHSCQPATGTNAIYRMASVVAALEQWAAKLDASDQDPMLGPPSLSVGTIRGGISVNTVPDRCRVEIDRRLLPWEHQEAARQAVIEFVERRCGVPEIEHHPPFITSPGLTSANNAKLSQQLLRAARAQLGSRSIVGVPYGTDAAFLAETGAPTVVFGPGSIKQAHTADEWIAVAQLRAAVAAIKEFVQNFAIPAAE